jgi:type II secretory pathway pseudopilin PulG
MKNVKPAGSAGYTFPLMLVIVSAMAFAASRLELAVSYRLKRDKEEELLFRGRAYLKAIQAFYAQNQQYPRRLDELAGDRQSAKRQYIRQLYKDPMTGGDFKTILTPEGTVAGVVSSSTDTPFRKVEFEKALDGFDKAKTYADWRFTVKPQEETGALQGPASQAPLPVMPPMFGSAPH